MAQAPRSVLIVDDHPGFRSSARLLLESEGYEVVGEAGDGATALAQIDALAPAIVLLDVQLPDVDGFDVAATVHAATKGGGGPVVVLVSSRDRSDFGPLLDRAEIRGFISKADLSGETLAEVLA